jgi:uncharacterized protein (TIGR00255 family)
MKETPRQALRSMTGYAVENAHQPHGQITLELRAVNSRFLDLSFRMGDDFRALEPALRERISARVNRGKLECRLSFLPLESASLPEAPNAELLQALSRLAAAVRQAVPEAAPLSVAEALRWPGMLGDAAPDMEALHAAAMSALTRALEQFDASRAR